MAYMELDRAPVKCPSPLDDYSPEKDLAQSLYFCGLGTLRYKKFLQPAVNDGVMFTPPLWGLVTAGFAADKLT
jgi:hypothetical protein